jgi:diguanylate cyclase (GGDEF)-like protein
LLVELATRSETDRLSGVLNRRGFEMGVERVLAEGDGAKSTSTMVMADLDHFKRINDTFGHATGDRFIANFARLLQAEANKHWIVGRIGGEEFAIVLDGGLVEGRAYAERVRSRIEEVSIGLTADNDQFTASFGVAEFQPGESLLDAFHRADGALYAAKAAGRNRVHVAAILSIVGSDNTTGPVRRLDTRRRTRA